jgi:hypothetical protein
VHLSIPEIEMGMKTVSESSGWEKGGKTNEKEGRKMERETLENCVN